MSSLSKLEWEWTTALLQRAAKAAPDGGYIESSLAMRLKKTSSVTMPAESVQAVLRQIEAARNDLAENDPVTIDLASLACRLRRSNGEPETQVSKLDCIARQFEYRLATAPPWAAEPEKRLNDRLRPIIEELRVRTVEACPACAEAWSLSADAASQRRFLQLELMAFVAASPYFATGADALFEMGQVCPDVLEGFAQQVSAANPEVMPTVLHHRLASSIYTALMPMSQIIAGAVMFQELLGSTMRVAGTKSLVTAAAVARRQDAAEAWTAFHKVIDVLQLLAEYLRANRGPPGSIRKFIEWVDRVTTVVGSAEKGCPESLRHGGIRRWPPHIFNAVRLSRIIDVFTLLDSDARRHVREVAHAKEGWPLHAAVLRLLDADLNRVWR
jgi:hypothetical protein